MVHFLVILKTYINDVFGGADSRANAADLIAQLIEVGRLTTAVMNPLECRGPARVMVILGPQ